ncbi:hypothetical protein M407DRAFT_11379 [Tulasnella calospora MUT 4182]|uniref:Uncharacterized protein n=1 Tax=Tulasnella calospora MUT 4182 TaxID=1051891 RepID=A0A0C3PWN5_9AGAM|nr:hypothetical protein M407DRAFT_11379 [Tulasnella calospora MUT 4182]
MPLVKCQYCSRKVEERTLMRHYSQTGCLQQAMASSPSRTKCPRRRHPRHLSLAHPPSESQPETNTHAPSPPSELEETTPSAGERLPSHSESTPGPRVRYPRVCLEEVPDEGDFPVHHHVTDVHPTAGHTLPGIFETTWERWRAKEEKQGTPPWGEFQSLEDWTFARFLMKSGLSQEKIDELLHLEVISNRTRPPFRNKYEFFKKIDALPRGPGFTCETVSIIGDVLDANGARLKEKVELWLRDPVECVRDLMGKVTLRNAMNYRPMKVYTGEDRKTRIFEEMWTGEWWWDIQDKLPKGATVAPIILASDKTQLSTFGGDKTAYPVYLTIGNIAKHVRRQPSQRATVLLGYLPVPLKNYEVFHACMARLLQPMIRAGKKGVPITCSDSRKRLVFPLLAAYCTDHPEQCLVACSPENRCPKGTIAREDCGGLRTCWGRAPEVTLAALQEVVDAKTTTERREVGGHSGDILHQLHKGVFHTHLVAWCDKLMAPGELDHRFMSMASHPDLRHFSKGITTIKQWTGKEQRAMERVFVGVVAGGVNDDRVIVAARSLLDFIYLAQVPCHTSETVTQMTDCLKDFHKNKAVFSENGVRGDFNIPKLHSLVHYADSIVACGAADGYNTEYPERLHIEYAKLGYHASNKREYQKQMVTWLERQEAVDIFDSYVTWATLLPTSALSNLHRLEALDHLEDSDQEIEDPKFIATGSSAEGKSSTYRHTSIRIAKRAPLLDIPIPVIQQHFGAPDLVSCLNIYILRLRASHPSLRVFPISPVDALNVYKRATLVVPPSALGIPFWEDRIRATPAKVEKVLPRLGMRPFFDTVLVKTPARSRYRYRVARVRVIFELPVYVATLDPQPTLAYVEWFTEFKATHHPSRMFEVSKVWRQDANLHQFSSLLRSGELPTLLKMANGQSCTEFY